MSKTILKLALSLALAATATAQQSLSNKYEFHEVTHPDSVYSVALGLNNLRQVAGTYYDYSGVAHGFVWQNGKFTDIDFPGASTALYGGTTAGGINDRGDVAGTYYTDDGFQHGYIMARPDFCFPGFNYDRKECAPVFRKVDFPGAAQLPNVVFEFGTGLGTAGVGLNDFQQVVGLYATQGQYSNGFIEFRGSYTAIDHPKASHSAGNGSKCFSISNLGVAACDYQTQASATAPQITHGFLRDGSTNIPIEVPGSAKAGFGTQVTAVNIFGVAVGVFTNTAGFQSMLYKQGTYYTVNFPGAPYNELHGINDRGDVTGAYATDANGTVLVGFVAFPK